MKTLLMMLAFSIIVLTSGCSKSVMIKPSLQTVNAKTQKSHSCEVTGTIDIDGNLTVSKKTAECIRTKMEICEKNNKKLETALLSVNAQIFLLNSFGYRKNPWLNQILKDER